MINKCMIENCSREIFVKKHMLCKSHAARLYKRGDPGLTSISKRRIFKPYWIKIQPVTQASL